MSASLVHEWRGTPTHDGPGHRYGDPGYCGGCWWDEVGRHETPTRRELHAPDCPACPPSAPGPGPSDDGLG